jgi:hypothetical protein
VALRETIIGLLSIDRIIELAVAKNPTPIAATLITAANKLGAESGLTGNWGTSK